MLLREDNQKFIIKFFLYCFNYYILVPNFLIMLRVIPIFLSFLIKQVIILKSMLECFFNLDLKDHY